MAKHNGWSNQETWLTQLWLQNDPRLYIQTHRMKSADHLKTWFLLLLSHHRLYNNQDMIVQEFDDIDLNKINWQEIFNKR